MRVGVLHLLDEAIAAWPHKRLIQMQYLLLVDKLKLDCGSKV